MLYGYERCPCGSWADLPDGARRSAGLMMLSEATTAPFSSLTGRTAKLSARGTSQTLVGDALVLEVANLLGGEARAC